MLKLDKVIMVLFLFTVAFYMRPAMVEAIIIDGNDWRQLTETTDVSWNALDGIYDINTGQLDTAITTIGALDFTGWTWASMSEVATMWSTLPGLTIGPLGWEQEINSAWAPHFFSLFAPTITEADLTRRCIGILRDEASSINGWYASLDDEPNLTNKFDQAYFGHIRKTSDTDPVGVWMYRATVPEPTTVVLLGIGLAGIAYVEVRRRLKKSADGNC